jgi:hypothetical protein
MNICAKRGYFTSLNTSVLLRQFYELQQVIYDIVVKTPNAPVTISALLSEWEHSTDPVLRRLTEDDIQAIWTYDSNFFIQDGVLVPQHEFPLSATKAQSAALASFVVALSLFALACVLAPSHKVAWF